MKQQDETEEIKYLCTVPGPGADVLLGKVRKEGMILGVIRERGQKGVMAVLAGTEGRLIFEPYNPEIHPPIEDFAVLTMAEFLQNEAVLPSEKRRAEKLTGASRKKHLFDEHEETVRRGGDPQFRMPKPAESFIGAIHPRNFGKKYDPN